VATHRASFLETVAAGGLANGNVWTEDGSFLDDLSANKYAFPGNLGHGAPLDLEIIPPKWRILADETRSRCIACPLWTLGCH